MLKCWTGLGRIGIGVALVLVGVGSDAATRFGRLTRPPNLVLIVGDDHGWPYAGFMGSDIVATPNLDALAAEGTVFTHVFAPGTLCQPTLRTLLSGMDSAAWEAQRNRTNVSFGSPLPRREEVQRYPTLPRLIKRRGYASLQAGKHWEGTFWMAGFTAGTARSVRPPPGSPANGFGRPSLEPMTDFLDTVGDTPFFLWLAPSIPHAPLDPPAELRAPYRARGLVEPAVLYYANITRLDRLIGEMLRELRARGLARDTLVVYLSDNGWEQAPDQIHFLGSLLGGPRGKGSIYELGTRAPTIFHWPGHVPPGRRDAGLATFADVNATLLDYAGVTLPSDHSGVSLRDRIEGRRHPGRSAVFGSTTFLRLREEEFVSGGSIMRLEEAAYVRTREWRFVAFPERGEHELYRIDTDPFEDVDVADQYPTIVAALSEMLDAELERRAQPATVVDVIGTARDILGMPIAGLPVTLRSQAGPRITLEVTTASDGSFRLPNVPAGNYWLRMPVTILIHEGRFWTNLPVVLTGLETGLNLNLHVLGLSPRRAEIPAGRSEISGRFVDGRGKPLAGLSVLLQAFGRASTPRLQLLTGPDGRFSMDQLPRGFYLLGAGPPSCVGERLVFLRNDVHVQIRQRLSCAEDRRPGRTPRVPPGKAARHRLHARE